jgi:hypothetical protein
MAKTLERFPGIESNKIEQLIEDLKWVIVTTLEQTIKFPVNKRIITAPRYYKQFSEEILSKAADTAILTFNYDICLDAALAMIGQDIDYGLRKTRGHGIPVLKLHGSINWTSELDSKSIVAWDIQRYLSNVATHLLPEVSVVIPIASQLKGLNLNVGRGESSSKVDGIPVIVPPSWNKSDSHRAVASVWRRAAAELSEAESIYILGYSLPVTDSFFRQLYALGTVGDSLLKRFWVFNPDETRDEAFRSMLGPGARERFRFFRVPFSGSFPTLKEVLVKN